MPCFELFDAQGSMRAICGGGRYDALLSALGDVDLPALGARFKELMAKPFVEGGYGKAKEMDKRAETGKAREHKSERYGTEHVSDQDGQQRRSENVPRDHEFPLLVRYGVGKGTGGRNDLNIGPGTVKPR